MTTRTWPTQKLFEPQTFQWGIAERVPQTESPFTGSITTGEVPFSLRFRVMIGWAESASYAEQQQRIAFLMSCRRSHRVQIWNMVHPAPAGTMRGLPTLFGAHAQGAVSLAINTPTADSLIAGDEIGVTTTAGLQVVTVIPTGSTVEYKSVGNILTVPVAQPLRAAANNAAAVTWDKPAPTFILVDGNWMSGFRPGVAEALTAEFIEVW